MTERIDQYIACKQQIAILEAQCDEIRPEIIAVMDLQHAEVMECGDKGTFLLQKRRTWKYPKEVQDLEATVKEQKKEAEQTGTATYEEKPVLVFKGR